MPNFKHHPRHKIVKMLIMADSGTGKTGATAALANAGYRCIYADFDAGLDVLGSFLTDEGKENVFYETFTDKLSLGTATLGRTDKSRAGVVPMPDGTPKAYPNFVKALDSWSFPEREDIDRSKIPAYDLGSIFDWGPETCFILDSLTFMGKAALLYSAALNGRKEAFWQSDWGEGQLRQERVLQILYSDRVKCNVIVNSHITKIGEKTDEKGNVKVAGKDMPSGLGKALPPVIPRYFNTIISAESKASGERVLKTVGNSTMQLKSPCPKELKREYPISDGLLKIIETIKGGQ